MERWKPGERIRHRDGTWATYRHRSGPETIAVDLDTRPRTDYWRIKDVAAAEPCGEERK